jgi:membrane fusion protein (multidrug efflux system)
MQAKANLVVAEYDLKKTIVRAPISGQIGTTAAHIGDYVAPSKGALATIVQIDPIRVSFPLTDRNYIAWRRAKVDGTEVKRRMRLILPDGQEYAEKGTWDFDDNKMSADTATILMRLSFPNKNRLLIPNSFVTLLTDFEKPPKFVSVPQSAIFDTQGGNVAVYVLKDDNTVEARVVKTKEMYKGWVPILEGVKAGEKVVISGTSKLGPGMKVVVVEPTGNEDIDPNFQPRIK